jgi:hypothetical protein
MSTTKLVPVTNELLSVLIKENQEILSKSLEVDSDLDLSKEFRWKNYPVVSKKTRSIERIFNHSRAKPFTEFLIRTHKEILVRSIGNSVKNVVDECNNAIIRVNGSSLNLPLFSRGIPGEINGRFSEEPLASYSINLRKFGVHIKSRKA